MTLYNLPLSGQARKNKEISQGCPRNVEGNRLALRQLEPLINELNSI